MVPEEGEVPTAEPIGGVLLAMIRGQRMGIVQLVNPASELVYSDGGFELDTSNHLLTASKPLIVSAL
jgi:hypothetical protein